MSESPIRVKHDWARGERIMRLLRIMNMLSAREWTVKQLCVRFEVGAKTVYRDLAVIRRLGVIVNEREECDEETMAMMSVYRIERNWLGRFK